MSKIERALVNKEDALRIFLDIEGAFNNAPPSCIKSVLNAKGIGSTVIRWIDSMLSHRIARVTSGVTTLEVQLLRFPTGRGSLCTVVDPNSRWTVKHTKYSRILCTGICG